jgi:hypothetical protein
MPKFQIKGHDFTFDSVYGPTHILDHGQAEILNRLLTKNLREAVARGEIKSRTEAEAWLKTPEALGPSGGSQPDSYIDLDLSELDELL